MYLFLVLFLGLTVLGFGIYWLIKGHETVSKPLESGQLEKKASSSDEELTTSVIKESEKESKLNPVLALEEAITTATKNGTLTDQEEAILREGAIKIGKDPDELIQQLREDLFGLEDPNTDLTDTNTRAGLLFEKYVVQKLNPQFFRLDHWAGDKFTAEKYAKTDLDPDIQVTLNTSEGRFPLAVECKWRSRQEGDFIWFSEDRQLQRYQRFAKKTGKPTFIALGLGGKPSDPKEVYLIPVQAFKRGIQHHANLKHYRKPNPEHGFFFDVESGELM